MTNYVDNLKDDYPYHLREDIKLWNDKKFQLDNNSKHLKDNSDVCHALVMKCALLYKRVRPDVDPGMSFLSSKIDE